GGTSLTFGDANGFQRAGLKYNGVAQLANNAARITRSTTVMQGNGTTPATFTAADVTLTGSVAVGETWTLTVGADTHSYTAQQGDVLGDVASALAAGFGLSTTGITISFTGLNDATFGFSVSGLAPTGGVIVAGRPTQSTASLIPWTEVEITI